MFRLNRRVPLLSDLEEAIAIDDLTHGRDRRGYTLAERSRMSLYARCINQGLEPERVAFACWLVGEKRVSDA